MDVEISQIGFLKQDKGAEAGTEVWRGWRSVPHVTDTPGSSEMTQNSPKKSPEDPRSDPKRPEVAKTTQKLGDS